MLGLSRINCHVLETKVTSVDDLKVEESTSSYILSFLYIEEKLNIILYELNNLIYYSSPSYKRYETLGEFTKDIKLDFYTKLNLIYKLYSLLDKEEYNLFVELVEVRNILAHNLFLKKEKDKLLKDRRKFVQEIILDYKNPKCIIKYKQKIIEGYKILNKIEIVISLMTNANFNTKELLKLNIENLLKKEKISYDELYHSLDMDILISVKDDIISDMDKKKIVQQYLSKIKYDGETYWDKIKTKLN